MRTTEFYPDNYYHLLNRGTDKRKIFIDNRDYRRFLVSLAVFNDRKSPPRHVGRFVKNFDILNKSYKPDKRDKLIDIIAFTLLPNHFHFFVRERQNGGISLFMQKVCMGYSHYFNLRNDRTGTLWQRTFEARHINDNSYFLHIMNYIHLNILDLYYPEWREGELKDWIRAEDKMRDYLWSSYGYYRTGKSKVPFMNLVLMKQDWFSEYFPELEDFEKNLKIWSLRNISEYINDL